jgi:hypothetical protein
MNLQMKLEGNQRALDPRCKCDMSRERYKAIATPVFINIEWKIKAFLNPNLYKLKKCRSKNSTNNGAECIGKSDPNVDLDSLWRRESQNKKKLRPMACCAQPPLCALVVVGVAPNS